MAKLICKRGTYQQFNIDPLSKARLTYAQTCAQHLTGLQPSTSGIVRAALALYVNKLESLLELPKDDPHVYNLRNEVIRVSGGDSVPWESFPRLDTGGDFPAFTALLKQQTKRPFDFLRHPISGGRK